ncbi:hypothetical protein Hdeb2414_s0005g00162681 [Helianthus debilis subsp. tardiflorus]
MKSINNNNNNDNNKSSNNNNWLGFTLSPHMNTNSTMEPSPPCSFSLPSNFNYTNMYEVGGENGDGIYSSFPIMPLKSDGSLCLMEAITRSHSQGLHRWTGRYEAHLWDNSCKKEGQSRKGRQGLNIKKKKKIQKP